MSKNFTFHVSGTHCASCKILIEDVLAEVAGVNKVEVNLKNEIVIVDMDTDKSNAELAEILTENIKPNGYTLSIEKKVLENTNDRIIFQAIPLGLLVLALFFLLQKSGILNFGIGGEVTPLTSFIVGLVASVSSCLAIVGGLVLSLSAKISKDDASDNKTFILFHSGRLVSFAVLGGVLGILGSAIGVNLTLTTILGIIASVVMLLLGFNLIGVLSKNKVALPSEIFNFFRRIEHKTLTPLIIGFATFFLPCGFTQSMQVVALSSGSFLGGLGIMLFFALGTLPMLALLSFGSASFAHSRYAPLFFKTAGVVVLGLGLFALLSGLAGLGVISPIFNI